MKMQKLKPKLFLLSAAAIWGLAFVAQRVSVKYIGPFTFNGLRFAIGFISLIPLMIFSRNKNRECSNIDHSMKSALPGGIIAGCTIFIAASLQQMGLVDTTAGKAAFITGLYIVLVPIIGIFIKQYIHATTWFGVAIAISGLYLLCVTESFSISRGDMLEMAGALFWALHIIAIDYFTKKTDAISLCFIQFAACSILSLTAGLIFEDTTIAGLIQAIIPILYGGICSVGIAYTLQVMGQKHTEPAHAAIILSMETVFASLGGFLILNENLGLRGYAGCALMLTGMLLSQMKHREKNKNEFSLLT